MALIINGEVLICWIISRELEFFEFSHSIATSNPISGGGPWLCPPFFPPHYYKPRDASSRSLCLEQCSCDSRNLLVGKAGKGGCFMGWGAKLDGWSMRDGAWWSHERNGVVEGGSKKGRRHKEKSSFFPEEDNEGPSVVVGDSRKAQGIQTP